MDAKMPFALPPPLLGARRLTILPDVAQNASGTRLK
jgi:hypothetical protein